MRSQSTGPADWVPDSEIYYVFDFHLLSIAQTFIPFFVLFIFNLVIVRKLTKNRGNLQQGDSHKLDSPSNDHSKNEHTLQLLRRAMFQSLNESDPTVMETKTECCQLSHPSESDSHFSATKVLAKTTISDPKRHIYNVGHCQHLSYLQQPPPHTDYFREVKIVPARQS
ncbi:hypothetical protein AB6A40_010061 [Gnathostoma spinigerum]|uniref:Uncharacterized protein n=1 Tax=Gnathostoma spinigerum TaxID=75299 RepID=A0ABD6EW62_9BILA